MKITRESECYGSMVYVCATGTPDTCPGGAEIGAECYKTVTETIRKASYAEAEESLRLMRVEAKKLIDDEDTPDHRRESVSRAYDRGTMMLRAIGKHDIDDEPDQ